MTVRLPPVAAGGACERPASSPMRHRCRTLTALLTGALLCLVHAAHANEPTAAELHSAQCVAALDTNTHDLAEQVKAGQDTMRDLLHERLLAGAAFVGDSYLHGNSDEKQSRELLNRALDAQKSLSPADLAARQAGCAAEGSKLFAASNGLQKSVVKRLAERRMERLLRP